MLSKLPRPTIFAHRGSSKYAPENTISAFNLAIQQGAHAIELDVMLSADNQLVVIHDKTVNRTTNGTGVVRKMNLADLRALDAGSYFDNKFLGEKIPTLEDVFRECGGNIFINIELKSNTPYIGPLTRILADLVIKFNIQDSVLFSSFNVLALKKIKNYLPECETGLLVENYYIESFKIKYLMKHISHQALHPSIFILTSELINRVHRNGRRIHVYTVDDGEMMKALIKMGVDGIFTNDPLLARQILESD